MIGTRQRVRSFALLLGLMTLGAATLVAAQTGPIPRDAKGLPLWEIRVYDDFPVLIRLDDHEQLDALLRQVPIASFHREQIRVIWEGGKIARLEFRPRVTEEEAAALQRAGFAYDRLPDLEQEGRREAERIWAEQYAAGGDAFRSGEKGVYHTHAQIGSLLVQTATDHPTIARTFNWGSSVLGRELWGIVISADVYNESAEPEVRLSSTMHGDEPPMMEMLLYLVEYLTDNYGASGYDDVTYLVDNYEIHILPLHNPDGYVAGTRGNANAVDLNRNFPEPAGTHPTREIETSYFMNYANNQEFVVSGNGHAGALVVNYPWDYTYTLAPDNDAIIQLSLEYSTYNLPMYNGSFPQGITNGAQWYVAYGTLQDWSYYVTGCIDVTLEISNTKWPPASQLDGLWNDNRESLLHYIKAARYGVNGIVTGSDTGLPLAATVTVVGNDEPVTTDSDFGDYYKLLDSGTYDITFSAPGYITETYYGVSTTWSIPTVLNVNLDPVAYGDLAGYVRDTGGIGLDASVEIRTFPGDVHVTTIYTDAGTDGYYAASLVYGEYLLIVSSDGYVSQERQVTIDATPASEDFYLSIAEETVLFADDFESGTSQWTFDTWGLDGGYNSPNSMADSPGGSYSRDANNACAMSSPVDLQDAVEGTLTFWAKWNIEPDWDCCVLEISTNGGSSWNALPTAYTSPASGQGAQTPAGMPVFEGNQASWVENTVDLAAYIGASDVRIRFSLRSDGSVQYDGFYFDDFEIRVVEDAATGVLESLVALSPELSARPNPFRPQTTLQFTNPQQGRVQLAVYDVHGRRVRLLVADDMLPSGVHAAVWDGRTDAGVPAASGVYFARFVSGSEPKSLKLVRLR